MSQLTLSEIWIYPIKSLGGIRVASARVVEKGLENDRRWMLVDGSNQFMTQRKIHPMALFKASIESDGLRVNFKDQTIWIPFNHAMGDFMEVKIWDDKVMVNEAGKEYSEWFSKMLGMECKLVHFPEDNQRQIDTNYVSEKKNVGLADGYPFLIIGQSSLDDLNARLKEPVPMNRFRPNFVFTGGKPYEEDQWANFTIGDNRFKGLKPCARCILTTVNQATAEKGSEPLLTLSRYRKVGDRILFGQNVIAVDHSSIKVGETIKIGSFA